MPKYIETRGVLMNRVLESDLNTLKKNVAGTVGIPTPENHYTYKIVHFKVPTTAEIAKKVGYCSLAALGGAVIGLITYFTFFH